jgi:hypothetical protein
MTSLSKREREFRDGIDEVAIVRDLLEEKSEFLDKFCKNKMTRMGRTPYIGYDQTPWGIMLQDPAINDVTSTIGKSFRRRFRVPYPLSDEVLVKECERIYLFGTKVTSLVRIPLKFKILMCLQILGRENCHDDIAELAQSFDSSSLAIFHQFIPKFVAHFFPLYVRIPEGERMVRTMRVYEQLGLPGACGSMDVTHITLGKCPREHTVICTGKEDEPTVAFNTVVDHFRFIHG